jgi:hypothetical protein
MLEPVPGLGIPYFGIVVAVVAILVVIAIQIMYAARMRRNFFANHANSDLLGNGNQAPATILSVWRTGVKFGINLQLGLRLQVQPTDGGSYEAETKVMLPKHVIDALQEGATVSVNVDPQDRTRVAMAVPT